MATAISQDDYLNDTSQFDLARKKASDQSVAALQARKDALARRFASLGNLDSGASLKQDQLATDAEASNLNNANESINAQQQAELGRRKEVIQGQQFQSGEAEKGRTFATSERLGGQEFAGQQGALGRAQQESQFGRSLSEQQAGRAQQGEQFGQTLAEQKAGRAQQGEQFGQTLAQSKDASAQQLNEFGQSLRASGHEGELNRALQEKLGAQQYDIQKRGMAQQLAALNNAINQFNQTFGEEKRINDINAVNTAETIKQNSRLGPLDQFGSDVSRGWKSWTGAISSPAY